MKGVTLINLKKHVDRRGVFRRLYCEKLLKKVKRNFEIKQVDLILKKINLLRILQLIN